MSATAEQSRLISIMQSQQQTISIEETAQILGIGRDAVRAGIRDGEIPSIRAGKHIKVPLPALMNMLRGDSRPDELEIARQMHLMCLRSSLERLDAERAILTQQIADIETADAPDRFNAYVDAARGRRRSA